MNNNASVNKCPYRSPMAVSDAIADIIRDKVVCELGCAEGDNLAFMGRYAKKVFGIEYLPRRYHHAQKRGFEVLIQDYRNSPIPDADVYYFWPDNVKRDSEYLVSKILKNQEFDGTIIAAGDAGFPPDSPVIKRIAKSGRLIEVPFNEGNGYRENGIFLLAIVERGK